MSSDSVSRGVPRGVVVPKTVVVPQTDPVLKARAELKAALFAIEEKANVPKRVGGATHRGIVKARAFSQRKPVETVLIVVGIAATVGGIVWAAARAYSR